MPVLHWINDADARRAASQVPFHLLERKAVYGDSDQAEKNLIVHGDNLVALKALLPFYKGKVKCIYIDPPYNTGSAFEHYDDNLEHSQWLSLMMPRLQLLREYLSEDGSIFVSIDDKEGCYLKVILDEIFGRKNFITSFIWKKVDSPNDNKVAVCPDHEFIHCYAKNATLNKFRKMKTADILGAYSKKDENGRLYRDRLLRKNGKNSLRTDRPTMWFPLIDPEGHEVFPIRDDGKEGRWASGKATVDKLIRDGELIWHKRKDKATGEIIWAPYTREYAPEDPERPYMTIWSDVNTTRQAKAHQKTIFSGVTLIDTIKPEELIKRILELATDKNDLVLDSFLGSGTTAAVAHKMGRRYIGVEMGEHALTHCVPRMKKVIEGEQGGISESVNWQGGGGFSFYELSAPVFDKYGAINPQVTFETLAAYVWQCETGCAGTPEKKPLLGVKDGVGIYLLYNGVLGDKRPEAGNVLTPELLESLMTQYPHDGPKVIYAEAMIGIDDLELREMQISFKQIPYDIRD